MAKGIVLERQGKMAIVLVQGEFRRLALPAHVQVGDEVNIPAAHSPLPRWTGAAAAAAAVIVGASLMIRQAPTAYAQTVAYVSVEFVPNFTLGLDALGRVTSVKPLDKGAATVARQVSLRGLPLDQAVSQIVHATVRDRMVGKTQPDALIMVTYPNRQKAVPKNDVAAVARARSAGAAALKESHLSSKVVSLGADQTAVKAAQKAHVPLGQYELWRQLNHMGIRVKLSALGHGGLGKLLEGPAGQKFLKQLAQAAATQQGSKTSPSGHGPQGTGSHQGQGQQGQGAKDQGQPQGSNGSKGQNGQGPGQDQGKHAGQGSHGAKFGGLLNLINRVKQQFDRTPPGQTDRGSGVKGQDGKENQNRGKSKGKQQNQSQGNGSSSPKSDQGGGAPQGRHGSGQANPKQSSQDQGHSSPGVPQDSGQPQSGRGSDGQGHDQGNHGRTRISQRNHGDQGSGQGRGGDQGSG